MKNTIGKTFKDLNYGVFKVRYFPNNPDYKIEILNENFFELDIQRTPFPRIVDTLAKEVIRLNELICEQEKSLGQIKVFADCIGKEVKEKLSIISESREPRML